jgi:lysophospholipase L1-like esterase
MKRRNIFTLLLTFFLMLALSLSTFAATLTPVRYVGIGDSIASGMSSTPGNDYYSKFSAYLAANAQTAQVPYSSFNAGFPGLTSTQLKDEIAGKTLITPTRAALAGATIVTISVGGNNLMYPLITYVAKLYGVPLTDPNFMTTLSAAVNANPSKLTSAMFWQILLPNSELKVAFTKGVSSFKTDLSPMIAGIKTLAPGTKIYFLNVFNPVYGNSTLRSFIDKYIVQINSELKLRATAYGYTVIDVYAKYKAYTGTIPLVGFNMAAKPATYDPHPTDAGHKAIYDLLIIAK